MERKIGFTVFFLKKDRLYVEYKRFLICSISISESPFLWRSEMDYKR